MKSPWDYTGPSIFTSSKEDKRNFGRNNGARGGAIPEFAKPKPTKPKPKKEKK